MFSRDSRSRTGLLAALAVAVALTAAPTAGAAVQDPEVDVDELIERYRQRLAEIEHRLQVRSVEARARVEEALAGQHAEVQAAVEGALQGRLAQAARRLQEVEEALARKERARERIVREAPQVRVREAGRYLLGMDTGADWVLAHAEELELTEDQEARIREAERAYRRAEIQRDAEIEVAELDLEDLLREELSADLGAVEEQMRRIADLRVQDRVARLRLRREIHGVLTPEQQEQLEEMRPNRLHARLLMEDGPAVWRFRGRPGEHFEFRMPELRERMRHWLDGDGHWRFFHFDDDEDEAEDGEAEGEVDGASRGGRTDAAGSVVVTG